MLKMLAKKGTVPERLIREVDGSDPVLVAFRTDDHELVVLVSVQRTDDVDIVRDLDPKAQSNVTSYKALEIGPLV